MTTKTDEIVDEDTRYDMVSRKYETLCEKLKRQSELDEAKHKEMLKSFELVNQKILDSCSKLTHKPPVPSEPEENYETNLERRRNRKKLYENRDLYSENRHWLVPKKGL